MQMTK